MLKPLRGTQCDSFPEIVKAINELRDVCNCHEQAIGANAKLIGNVSDFQGAPKEARTKKEKGV